MRLSWVLRLQCLFACLWAITTAAHAVTVLKTFGQDNAVPKFVRTGSGAGGTTTGFCVDALRAIERVNPNLRIEGEQTLMPAGQIENALATGQIDVACGFVRSDARAARFTYLEPALFNAKYVLAARADDPVAVDSLDDVRKLGDEGIVLGVHGLSVMGALARESGLKVDDAGITPEANLRKLLLGRGRFFFYRNPGMRAAIFQAGLGTKIRVLPGTIYTAKLYMLASKRLPKETLEELQRAIGELSRSGELGRIYERWVEQDR